MRATDNIKAFPMPSQLDTNVLPSCVTSSERKSHYRTPRWTRARSLIVAAAAFALTGAANAYTPLTRDNINVAQSTVRPAAIPPRVATVQNAPSWPVVASSTAPGQAGYVHYFVITGPDGEPESEVGIELSDGRIAWSFPEIGVVISPFIASGHVIANGKWYEVEHLYGLRPFRHESSMRRLQQNLDERVAWWLRAKTPYCDEEAPSDALCVSCLGFVLRVLYPGSSPELPALPSDFKSAKNGLYTTEDLLMYLAGVRLDLPRDARLNRIAALRGPANLREQLMRIASSNETPQQTLAGHNSRGTGAVAKPRSSGRSVAQSPKRALSRRRS